MRLGLPIPRLTGLCGLMITGLLCWFGLCGQALAYSDVVAQWAEIKPLPAPEIKPVSLDPRTTALLVLDMEKNTCNAANRPRCLETTEAIVKLLAKAREAKAFVAHSITQRGTAEDVLPACAPQKGEPLVSSSVNKFFRTDLGPILGKAGIKTVIVVGTAADGAVLHTATHAAQMGLNLVIPVDGLSASSLQSEAAAIDVLRLGPATKGVTSFTRCELISFSK